MDVAPVSVRIGHRVAVGEEAERRTAAVMGLTHPGTMVEVAAEALLLVLHLLLVALQTPGAPVDLPTSLRRTTGLAVAAAKPLSGLMGHRPLVEMEALVKATPSLVAQ
jgi:hypothetical protein